MAVLQVEFLVALESVEDHRGMQAKHRSKSTAGVPANPRASTSKDPHGTKVQALRRTSKPTPKIFTSRSSATSADAPLATSAEPLQAQAAPPTKSDYPERLLRLSDVLFVTGLGKTSVYAAMQTGSFPAAVRLTERSVAWRESEVIAWVTSRVPA